MDPAILSYAFVVGMAATVNPCGVALLPAYLTWFTRSERTTSPAARVLRAVGAGVVVTAGFAVVFGAVGGVLSAGLGSVMAATPYVGVAVGVVLVGVGVLTVAGRQVSIRLPGSGRPLGSGGRGLRAMAGFGVSYALASLGCALPVFLAGVTPAFAHHGALAGVGAFLAYALGMGVVLTALAVVVVVAPAARLTAVRAAGSRMQRPAGVVLVLVGAYVVYYWVVGGLLGSRAGSGLITVVDGAAARVGSVMSVRVGLALAAFVVVVAAVAALGQRRRCTPPAGRPGPDATPAQAGGGAGAGAVGPPAGFRGYRSWRARHPRLRRAMPFATVGVAAALAEAVVLSGLLAPSSPPPPEAAAASVSPVSPSVGRMLGLDWLGSRHAVTPAPFSLTDQHGRRVSLASFRGRAVILSFNDNHCTTLCPLYAGDVRAAVADLGPLARRVAFVAVNVNPFYPGVASDVAFDAEHGLAKVPEWHYLTGPLPVLRKVWRSFGETPIIGPDRSITHDTSLWFITPSGKVHGIGLYGPSAVDATRWGYALATLAAHLLGVHVTLAARTAAAAPRVPAVRAPNFSLPDVGAGRGPVSLASLRGEPAVVNFFASWCSACQAEAPGLVQSIRRFGRSVHFVGVDVNDTRPSVRAYLRRFHLGYRVGFDSTGAVAASFGVTGLPITVFLSPSGRIVGRHIGGISPAALDRQVEGLLGR